MISLYVDMTRADKLLGKTKLGPAVARDAVLGAREAVRDRFQRMAERTHSRVFWGRAKQSVEPPVLYDSMASFAITQVGVRLQWLGGTVRPTGRRSEVTGRPIRSLLIPFKDSPLRRRSLASLNFPEEEVMVLGDVASGRAVLARVRERKRRRDGLYQDVTLLGALVRSATIPAHPEVMPSEEEMGQYVVKAARLVLQRLLKQSRIS